MDKAQLKYSSIMNVPLQAYDNDFSFIVNGQVFKTSRIVSDLLSPKISRIHSNDPTSDTFVINTQHQGDFSHILQLASFNEISIQNDEAEFFCEVMEQLGEENLQLELKSTELTVDNVFSQFKNKIFFNKIIEFISSHFTEIIDKYKEKMIELDESILIKIVNSSELRLNEEDDLLKFVNEMYKIDSKYSILYKSVIFKNVSKSSINEFLDVFDFNDIDGDIWSTLSLRLSSDIQNLNCEDFDRYKITQRNCLNFVYDEKNELNGIFKYLTNQIGGNIHDKGIIEVTSNVTNNSYPPKNLLDFNENKFFYSQGAVQNAWICFDFRNYEVKISNYTIKSHKYTKGFTHLKNWAIEISNDKINWTKIDEHSNYTELNNPLVIKTFNVSSCGFAKYVRLRQTGEYYGYPSYLLSIGSIEFYGNLKEISK